MYLYDMATPTVSTSTPASAPAPALAPAPAPSAHAPSASNSATKELGKIICKYFAVYYTKDSNLEGFKTFIAGMQTAPTTSGLPDEDKTTLHDLVKDLVGKTDTHTSAVFGEFVNNSDWENGFTLDKIYDVTATPSGMPPTQSKLKSINVPDEVLRKIFMTKYTSSTEIDLSKYYADTKPDAQLSLLMQVIKLSGCVRLVCCLHVIYKQYKFLQQKIGQMSQMNKGLSKDLATDAVDDLFRKLASNAYNAGYFGDIKLFMDACGVKVIQYYKTKITELISADRLELTGTTDKLSVQSVFNRTLTKLLMFLRLNLIFTDYIQFKKRIVRDPQKVNGLQNNSSTWEDVFDLKDDDSSTGPKTSSVNYKYVLFMDDPVGLSLATGGTPATLTGIQVTSIYPTFDTIIGNLKDATKPDNYKFTIPLTNIKYYYDGNKYYSGTLGIDTNSAKKISVIVCAEPSTAPPTEYIFFVRIGSLIGSGINISRKPEYSTSRTGSEIISVINGITTPALATLAAPTPTSQKYTITAMDVNIQSAENSELYYVHPLYPNQPMIDSVLEGGSGAPVYYYSVTEEIEGYPKKGNPTHKLFETKQDYYVSMFPTFEKLEKVTTATPAPTAIQLPEKIDLAGLATTATPPEPWTFSDFVGVYSRLPGLTQKGGSAEGESVYQIGGEGEYDVFINILKEVIGLTTSSQINDEAINKIIENVNTQITTYNSAEKTQVKGQTSEAANVIEEFQYKLAIFYYIYKYVTNTSTISENICKLLTKLVNDVTSINTQQKKLASQVEKNNPPTIENTIKLIRDTPKMDNYPFISASDKDKDKYDFELSKTKLLEELNKKCTSTATTAQTTTLPTNDAASITQEEAERKAKEEADKKAKEEAERKAKAAQEQVNQFLIYIATLTTLNFAGLADLQKQITALKASITPGLTKEELTALLAKFKEELLGEFTKEGDDNPIRKIVTAVILQEFNAQFATFSAGVDAKLAQQNSDLQAKLASFTAAQTKSFEELLKQISDADAKRDAAQQAVIEKLEDANTKLGTATNKTEQLVQDVTQLKEQLAKLVKERAATAKTDEAALATAVVAEVVRQMPKTDIKQGDVTQTTGAITVQAPNLEPIGKAIEAMTTAMTQMNSQNQQSIDRIIDALKQNKQAAAEPAAKAANNAATKALTDSIAALQTTIESMKQDTINLQKINEIHEKHNKEIKTLMEQHVTELKASQDKLITEVAKVQKEAKSERMATNNRNRKERETENDKRREHELMILSLAKEEREKILSDMLVAKQTGDSDLLTKFTEMNNNNNLVITQLIELLKAQGVSGAQMVQLSMVPAAQSQLASFGMGQQPQQAQQVQPQQAQLHQSPQAAVQVTGQGVQAAASASTTKKIPKYNFKVMPIATPPTLSQKINIVDTVDKLFTEVDALFVTAATGAAAAAPPSLTSNKYYFVIGYNVPTTAGTSTATATQLKYEFTTMIDLPKHTSDSIRCIYAVSGEEKGPITINCMKSDTVLLNTRIANHTGTHINNYITKSTTP